MKNQQDRIAIIGAIQDASTNELNALAEIKKAITSHGVAPEDTSRPKGRVSRRLKRSPETAPRTREKPEGRVDTYAERRRRPNKPKKHINTGNNNAVRRQRLHARIGDTENTAIPAAGDSEISISVAAAQAKPSEAKTTVARAISTDTPLEKTSNAPAAGRDSKGRFTSQGKNEELSRRKDQKEKEHAEAELQKGFIRKIGSLLGSGNSADGDAITNAAGMAAGGPLWMATKGVTDIAREAGEKVVSLKKWVSKRSDDTDGEEKAEPESARKETIQHPAITYPPAQAQVMPAPQIGKPRSSSAFASAVETRSTQVVQEQTKVLASNDERIIDGLEDVTDEIVKLRKLMRKAEGFSLGDLFGRRRGRLGRGLRGSRPGDVSGYSERNRNKKSQKTKGEKGAGRDIDVSTADKGKKTSPHKPKKPIKARRAGKFSKVAQIFSGLGGKATAGIAAGTTAIAGGATALKNKIPGLSKSAAGATEAAGGATEALTKKTTHSAVKASKVAESAAGATEKASKQALAKVADTGAGKVALNAGEAAADKAVVKGAEKVAVKGGEKAAQSAVATGAAKVASKVALKGAARAIPIVGTLGMAGYDAVDGYNDAEAQQQAFDLKNGQEATTQQKVSYAGANVLDMGGIVSGSANLLGKGLSALGMSSAGETLKNFDTGTIARGLNSSIEGGKALVSSATAIASGVADKVASGFSTSDESTKQVKKAVEDGTQKTVYAINALKGQLQGGVDGQDGVGAYGNQSALEFSAPEANTIAADLNIGGKNAKNRNFRNNNIGNLNFANQEGASLEAANGKGERRFAHFNTPEEGIRALGNQVSSYYNGTSKAAGYNKLQTVSSIIAKWAPPNENNTNQYIKNVCDYLGVSPTQKIDVSDPDVMTRLVRAIATKEGGNPAVNDDFIKSALGKFNQGTGRWEGQFSNESLSKINQARAAKGQQALARDSQYSAGGKVKLANGTAPAAPVKNAVQIVSPEPEVVQHAQSAKKPAVRRLQEQRHEAAKSAAAGTTSPAPAAVSSVGPEDYLKAATGDVDAQARVLGNIAGDQSEGSVGGLMLDMAKTNAGLAKDMMFSGGSDGFSQKVTQANRAMSDNIFKLTGKRFGFQKAAPLAAIQRPLQQKTAARTPDKDVNLLAGDPGQTATGAAVKTNERGIPVYDNGWRVTSDDDSGIMGSLLDSSINGLKSIGAAVIPTAGEHTSRLIGGMDANTMLDELLSEATGGNTEIARSVSPVTRQLGDWLNGSIQNTATGVQGAAGNVNNALFGAQPGAQEPFLSMPPQLQTVTDLAKSGIRQPLTSDSVNHDPAMLKALDNVYGVLKEILGTSKKAANGDPDKVVKTAQPQPRQRASTTITDPSLDALLED
ncbi:transglycosylase (plasmid) [Raoultella ornithinolytica]|uniref:transglycosylase n=1 Tax=Raoultella ornithinolytica TaxID=54291 RepID=UPI00292BD5BA|nr:transglycosylase [Raoultella ornithinolytica]MDV1094951.1 transglycosylase [Raoultella ornithinolytica]MDV1122705.1 transglycosylase [Raoultella ornithinolytica]MDV1893220.1 transglycosylase [Raoultella ornithinolytica]